MIVNVAATLTALTLYNHPVTQVIVGNHATVAWLGIEQPAREEPQTAPITMKMTWTYAADARDPAKDAIVFAWQELVNGQFQPESYIDVALRYKDGAVDANCLSATDRSPFLGKRYTVKLCVTPEGDGVIWQGPCGGLGQGVDGSYSTVNRILTGAPLPVNGTEARQRSTYLQVEGAHFDTDVTDANLDLDPAKEQLSRIHRHNLGIYRRVDDDGAR